VSEPLPPRREAGERLLACLRESIRTRWPEGQRVDCALSGGVDSSTLLALAAERGPVRAWVMRDAATAPAELEHARNLCRVVGITPTEVVIPERALPGAFDETVRACGVPIYNARAIAKHLWFRSLAAAGVERLLSGVGADEVLLGNPASLRAQPNGVPAFLASRSEEVELGRTLGMDPPPWLEPVHAAGPRQAQGLLTNKILANEGLPVERTQARSLGIAVELPFLDERVTREADAIPADWLLDDGRGKGVLRDALAGLLPDGIRRQQKQPCLFPAGGSDRTHRCAWHDLYARWLTPTRLSRHASLRAHAVRQLLEDYVEPAPGSPSLEIRDRVLMRLTSTLVLEGS
jgi:asparagine synthetase B (glutamine-hydrolysing)